MDTDPQLSPVLRETSKPLIKSKTIWLNLLALGALAVPPAQAWLAANPEAALALLGAANVLVRLATRDRIELFPETDGTDAGKLPLWLLVAGLAGLMGLALPACAPEAPGTRPAQFPPISVTYHKGGTTVSYDSKGGLTVDQDSGK